MEGSMRQKIKGAHQAYALATLTCQDGHELGKVLMQPDKRLIPMSGTGWVSDDPLSKPLAMHCQRCEALGRRLDLRGSWQKITQILEETLVDPRRGVVSYALGRQQSC